MVEPADCDFYHAFTFPDGSEQPGAWDLRGGEHDYLGHIDLAGRRVLELGPASGHLSVTMTAAGAEVVCLEAGFDYSVDLLPRTERDLAAHRSAMMAFTGRVNNSWWYARRRFGSPAKMVYGSIYEPPADLGTFDHAVFGAILLHLENPFRALWEAARMTTGALVVTEVMAAWPGDPEADALVRFAPGSDEDMTGWWHFTPAAVMRMLAVLGFGRAEVSHHRQRHHLGHDLDAPPVEAGMFTVVGHRA